jgi:N-acetylglucosamine-6-phosphate deacetylase
MPRTGAGERDPRAHVAGGAIRGPHEIPMPRTIVKGAHVILPDRTAEGLAVAIEDGRIAAVGPVDELSARAGDAVVDAAGHTLAPGFIDLHIHGVHASLVDKSPEDLAEACRILPRYGETGFLPTVCPRPKGEDAKHLAALATVRSAGTQILGFHLEGPFLSLTGALPPEALGSDDPERVRALIQAARPFPAIFSISPEFDGITNLLPLMTACGLPAFITHTRANVRQTQAAIAGGARHATHFYDVFHVPADYEPGARPCGAVEAILADPRVTVDFILDGVHVDPVAVQMALQTKGPRGVCLITDAMVGAGLPPGRRAFGEMEVEFAYEGAPARIRSGSPHIGGLAGSGLTLDCAVRNAVKMLGVDVGQAVRMASANPARVLGLGHCKGAIAAGYDADLVLLDAALHVTRTWVGGRCVFTGSP